MQLSVVSSQLKLQTSSMLFSWKMTTTTSWTVRVLLHVCIILWVSESLKTFFFSLLSMPQPCGCVHANVVKFWKEKWWNLKENWSLNRSEKPVRVSVIILRWFNKKNSNLIENKEEFYEFHALMLLRNRLISLKISKFSLFTNLAFVSQRLQNNLTCWFARTNTKFHHRVLVSEKNKKRQERRNKLNWERHSFRSRFWNI